MQCKDCKFWNNKKISKWSYLEGEGQCRRHPPQAEAAFNRDLRFWPTAKEDDWGGEFEAKETS